MGGFCKPQKLKTDQTASTTALQPYSGRYEDLLNRSWDVSNTAYNPATNAGVAGFSSPQTQAFNLAQQNVGSYQPYLAAATGAAGLGAAPSYMNVGQYMNPFDQYVTGSLMNDYDQMINRNRQMSNSDAARAGALTGDRRYVAQSIGQEGLDRALASNLANVRQQGYNTALQTAQADALRQLQASGTLSNLGTLAQQYGYNDVNAMLGIGGMQQAQQQRELDTATQNALRQAAYPFETTQWATNLATGLGGAAGSQSSGQTIQPGPSYFQQILGAATAAAGAYAKSDERIKDDIEEIGSTHDGQPIYRYRLEGSPKHEIGLLAQNVEKTHPEAVSSLGGIKHVNYKTATDDSVRGKYALGGGMPYGGGLSYVPQIQMQPTKLAAPQFKMPAPRFVEPTKIDNGMDKILSNFTNAYGSVKKNRKQTGSWTNPDTGEVSKYYEPSNASKLGDWLGTQATNAWGGLNNLGSGISSGLSGIGSYFGLRDGGVVRHGYYNGGLTPFDYYSPYVPDNNDDELNLIEADPRLASWTKQQGYVPPPRENKTTTIPLIDQNVFSPQDYFNSNRENSEPETRVIETAPIPPESVPFTQTSQTETEDDTITPKYLMRAGLGDVKPPKNTEDDSEGTNLFGFKVSPDAANALVAAGLGMMASPSPFIGQAIGQGGLAGMNYYMNAKQQRAELEKEKRKEAEQRLKDEVDLTLKRARTEDLLKDKKKYQKIGNDDEGNEVYGWVSESGKIERASPSTSYASSSGSPSAETSSGITRVSTASNEVDDLISRMSPEDQIAYRAARKKGNAEQLKKITDFYKGKEESRESIIGTLKNLEEIPKIYTRTFETAIGPDSGSDYGENWYDQLGNAGKAIAGTIGRAENIIKGGRFTTDEVRSAIKQQTNALISKFRTLQGLTAKNTDSNRELQFLIDQAGSLTQAKTVAEYYRRMEGLNKLINDTFLIEIGYVVPKVDDSFTSKMFEDTEYLAKKYPGFIKK